MRRLVKPVYTARQVMDLCIASIRDDDLSRRLGLATDAVEAAESHYIELADIAELYKVERTNDVAGHVSAAEMGRVYGDTFVRSVKTRTIYGALMKAPENDICPLCGQRTVFTLDHYLPKGAHPALAVTSLNLVPACGECNKLKLDRQASCAADQTLHPYFDDVDHDRWLFAEVNESFPATLSFAASPPVDWDQVKRQRVVNHFEAFNLARLYASHSAVELNNIKFYLQRMALRNSPADISAHLSEVAASSAASQRNSWQSAMYAAISLSPWFCGGGFQ